MEPTTITEAAEALTGYWAFLKRRGRTASTIRKYAETLVPFLDWVRDRPLSEIKARDIEFWLIQWSESFAERFCREPSAAAQKSQVCALRGFFGYLERLEYIDRNPCHMIEAPKVARKPIQHLTPDEDEALLNAVLSPQERILIPLLRFTGLRVEEAQTITWADVTDGLIHVRKSKTPTGIRAVPIFEAVSKALIPWKLHQQALGVFGPDMTVLATRRGRPMEHQHMWKLVKRVADRAGVRRRNDPHGINISEISPHTLRRQYATWMLGRGVRVEALAAALGHSSPTITMQSYAAWNQEKLMAELMAHSSGGPRKTRNPVGSA